MVLVPGTLLDTTIIIISHIVQAMQLYSTKCHTIPVLVLQNTATVPYSYPRVPGAVPRDARILVVVVLVVVVVVVVKCE